MLNRKAEGKLTRLVCTDQNEDGKTYMGVTMR